MLTQGFNVERQHLLPTAWLATFTHGKGGRTIGVNSEVRFYIYQDMTDQMVIFSDFGVDGRFEGHWPCMRS